MVLLIYRARASSDERSKKLSKRRDKKVAFYETEKAKEQTEDMRMYIQTVEESKGSFTVGS